MGVALDITAISKVIRQNYEDIFIALLPKVQIASMEFTLTVTCDSDKLKYMLEKYTSPNRIIEYVEMIKSGSMCMPTDVIINHRSYEFLIYIACRYNNYHWLDAFMSMNKNISLVSYKMDAQMIKYLIMIRRISLFIYDMLKIYKFNDPNLIFDAKSLLSGSEKNGYL